MFQESSPRYRMSWMNFCHLTKCATLEVLLSLWEMWNLRRKKVLGFAKRDEHKESPAGRGKAHRGKRRSQIARISDCCIQQGPLTPSIVIDSAQRRRQKRLCHLHLLTFGTQEQQQSPAATWKSMWHFHPSTFLFRWQKKTTLESPDREGGEEEEKTEINDNQFQRMRDESKHKHGGKSRGVSE